MKKQGDKNGICKFREIRFKGISHVEGAVKALDLALSADEIKALEEYYKPHTLSGVMAQNTPAARSTEQVWIKNGKYQK